MKLIPENKPKDIFADYRYLEDTPLEVDRILPDKDKLNKLSSIYPDYKTPHDYSPYYGVVFGGSVIHGCRYLFLHNENIPVLIGKGDDPILWMSDKSNCSGYIKLEGKKKENGNILFEYNESNVLELSKVEENLIIIVYINLRPIGVNVLGYADKVILGDGINFPFSDVAYEIYQRK